MTTAKTITKARLTPAQIELIQEKITFYFGPHSLVWLFGSRADPTRRGGDVDLYIEPTHEDTLIPKLRCKIALEDALDLSVDLVVKEQGKDDPIYHLAKTNGIRL